MTLIPKNDRVPVQKLGDPLLVGEDPLRRDIVEQIVDAAQHEADRGPGRQHAGVQQPAHLPGQKAALPGIADIVASETGIPVPAVGCQGVSQQDDPHLPGRCRQDAADNPVGEGCAGCHRRPCSVAVHRPEEIPHFDDEDLLPGGVEHHSVGGICRGERALLAEPIRRVEPVDSLSGGPRSQGVVELPDPGIYGGMCGRNRRCQEQHRPDARCVEPHADRTEGFQNTRQQLPEEDHPDDGQHPRQQEGHQGRHLLDDDLSVLQAVLALGLLQAVVNLLYAKEGEPFF